MRASPLNLVDDAALGQVRKQAARILKGATACGGALQIAFATRSGVEYHSLRTCGAA